MARLALRGRRSGRPNAAPDEETRAHVAGAASAAAAEVAGPPIIHPDRTGAALLLGTHVGDGANDTLAPWESRVLELA